MRKYYKKILYKINNRLVFLLLKYIPFQIKFYFLPFPKYQFGLSPRKSIEFYEKLFRKYKDIKYLEIDKFENQYQKKINKNYIDKLAKYTQIVIKKKSKINYQHGRLLYAIIYKYIKKNKIKFINIFETGTARGFSSICMAKAIIDTKSNGLIETIDIIPHNLKMYWNVFTDHYSELSRNELLKNWKKETKKIKFIQEWSYIFTKKNKISKKRYHFVFLDGAHNFKTVLQEFLFVKKNQKKNDLIFFDDISSTFEEMLEFKKYMLRNFKEYKITIIKCDRQRSYMLATKIY